MFASGSISVATLHSPSNSRLRLIVPVIQHEAAKRKYIHPEANITNTTILTESKSKSLTAMGPKPFNPPRPTSTIAAPGTKPRGRPKGSTNNPSSTTKRKSRGSVDKPSKVSKTKTASASTSKSKSGERGGEERNSGFARPRVSNASTVLDLSSGDEEAEEGDNEDGEEEDVEMEDPDDEDPFSSQPTRRKPQAPSDPGEGPAGGLISNRQTSIPSDLINVLLHGFFKEDKSRISNDANAAVGRYIETFVREAVNRADWAKRNGWEEGGGVEVDAAGGGQYLEVEDLERLAPQLLLDF